MKTPVRAAAGAASRVLRSAAGAVVGEAGAVVGEACAAEAIPVGSRLFCMGGILRSSKAPIMLRF